MASYNEIKHAGKGNYKRGGAAEESAESSLGRDDACARVFRCENDGGGRTLDRPGDAGRGSPSAPSRLRSPPEQM